MPRAWPARGGPELGLVDAGVQRVRNAGASTNKHPLYIQSDELVYPNAVFRMQYNYVHHGKGGNLLKSRHQRNEIYYNWFEGATYQELELIGPDCETQVAGWHAELKREDSDVVGNVIVHTSNWSNVIRAGGDLNGRSQGRVRLANNTIIVDRAGGGANAVYVQLGLDSLEMHNNVVYQPGSAAPAIVRENSGGGTPVCGPASTQAWVAGRKVFGTNNWVETGASLIPVEWGVTEKGTDPRLQNIAQRQMWPAAGSPLLNRGVNQPPAPPAFPFPMPLNAPRYLPPQHAKLGLNGQLARPVVGGTIDIGAFEGSTAP